MGNASRAVPPSNRWNGCLAAVALLLLMVLAAGCRRDPPEAALRTALAELQHAIDNRDASAIAALLSEDFIGPDGMDRDATRRYATVVFMRHGDISTRIGPLDLTLQDDHARVRFTAALAGGSGGLVPDRARIREVDSGWRLESGEWRLLSAHWED